jgi:hypothetical protein
MLCLKPFLPVEAIHYDPKNGKTVDALPQTRQSQFLPGKLSGANNPVFFSLAGGSRIRYDFFGYN